MSLDFIFVSALNKDSNYFIETAERLINGEMHTRNSIIIINNSSVFSESLIILPKPIHPGIKWPVEIEHNHFSYSFGKEKGSIVKLPSNEEYISIWSMKLLSFYNIESTSGTQTPIKLLKKFQKLKLIN